MNQPVQQHPASVDAYIRHGWSLVPIPHGTKGPQTSEWNLKKNALNCQSDLPPGFGIGLAHAYSGTMALDIDNWDVASHLLNELGVDLQALYDAPDAVIIDSGRQGHGKLLYTMPFGLTLPTKRITQKGTTIYELRCATANGLTVQDVLPPTIHPDTKQSYRWAGKGHWSRLPVIPDAVLAIWQDIISDDKERIVPVDESLDTNWDEIVSAVASVNPNTSREEWINIGMALHWAGVHTNKLDQALYYWNEWSKGSADKYPGERAILTQWSSFKSDKSNSVKLGTLFHIAKTHGWVKPMPDVSEFFKATDEPAQNPVDVIDGLRPPAPDLNFDLFPEILAKRALEISESIGCDPLVPLTAGLAAVAGVVDAEIRLELMPGFKVPPIVWLMTLGDPADKKSPGSRPMFEGIKHIEAEDRPRYKKALLDWEGKEAAYAAAKKSFLEFSSSTEAMLSGDQAPEVPEMELQPVPVKITVSDITSQKLVRHAADRPRGLLCYLDEMNSWVRKLTDKMGGDDRSTWVVGYEGQPYEMDRVGAGSIYCDNFAVSIYGNIQPAIFRDSVEALGTDGLLQRFIPVILRSSKTKLGNPVPDYLTKREAWEQTLRIAYAIPKQTYTLSPEAYQEYRNFQQWYERAKRDEKLIGSSDLFMTAFGKIEGTVGRIALLFHLIESPFSPQVSRKTMENVVMFAKSYIIPSFRYALGEVIGTETFDTWLSNYLIQHSDKELITLSDIKRAARRQVQFKGKPQWIQYEMIYGAMSHLENVQWVARIDDGEDEYKHRAQWYINPALKDLFKDYRAEVIAAKQRQLDHIYRLSTKEKPRVHGYDQI